ncbi:MAG: S41 family peptidase, partial [Acidobacteriota bacterium]
ANAFLSRGQTVFTQKGRLDGVGDTYRAENLNPEKMPLVVLVNQSSASASEILAGALQDHDRALIVGENSFGKGLVQNPFVLEYGSMLLLTIAKYETPSGRLIQRDYSNGNLYDYYNNSEGDAPPNKGTETKTDTGRSVYSGGGIAPDEAVKPNTIPIERARQQQKLLDPLFAFSLDLSFGKVAGYETYKVDRAITYNYNLKTNDFPVSDALFQDFKKFAMNQYKIPASLIDKEREFIQRNLRSELVTAAYGTTTQSQVFREIDNQLTRAIELLPRAKQLALEAAKVKSTAELNK